MPREAVIGTVVAAVSVWAMLITTFLPRQHVPGGDFMQFYTLGAAARSGDWALQYDWPRLYDKQVSLVPESAPYPYKPSYPPLVAAFYAPYAALPFRPAYAVWAVTAAAVYLGLMLAVSRANRRLRGAAALAVALLFPPFIALILTGQTTLVPLIGFVAGWMLLDRRREVLAGLALALVAFKPNFGIALAGVLVVTASWRAVAGIAIGVLLIATATYVVCGPDVMRAWWDVTFSIVRNPSLIEPDDVRHTHALRTGLESVAAPAVAFGVWLIVSALAIGLAARAWRQGSGTLRFSALLLATVVVSPHVLSYDAVLLAPACLWLFDHGIRTGQRAMLGGVLVLSVLYVVPNARVLGVPLTVPVALWLMSRCR